MHTPHLALGNLPATPVASRTAPDPAGTAASPPHLLQVLPEELRGMFLRRWVARAPDARQAAVQLRGWACISRAHRAEVRALLNEPGYCFISLNATARVIPVAISLYSHPGNCKNKVREAMQALSRDCAQLQLSFGSHLGLLHEFRSHCAQLGRLITDTGVRYLRLEMTGLSYDRSLDEFFRGLRKAEAKPGASLPELEVRWLKARPDPPMLSLLHGLSNSLLGCQLVRLDLRGMRLEPDDELLTAESIAPLFFSALQGLAMQARELDVVHLAGARISAWLPELIAALQCCSSLRRLDLRDCALNAEHADVLLPWLDSRVDLTLNLRGNPIPPEHRIWKFDAATQPRPG